MSEGDAHTSGTTRPNSPAWNLYLALAALADFGRNGASAFRELTEAREVYQTTMAAMHAATGLDSVLERTHTTTPDHAAALHRLISDARESCEDAHRAIADGGAAGWDEGTSPNSAGQRRSHEMRTKLLALERTLPILDLLPDNPTHRAGDQIDTLATLAAWFAFARDDLQAVFAAKRDAAKREAAEAIPELPITTEHMDAIRPELLAKLKEAREGTRCDFEALAGADLDEVFKVRSVCQWAMRTARIADRNLIRDTFVVRDGFLMEDLIWKLGQPLVYLAKLDELMRLAHPLFDGAQRSGAWDRLIAASPATPEPWMDYAGCAPFIAWQYASGLLWDAVFAASRNGAKCGTEMTPRIDDVALTHHPGLLVTDLALDTARRRPTDSDFRVLEARLDWERVKVRERTPATATQTQRATPAKPIAPVIVPMPQGVEYSEKNVQRMRTTSAYLECGDVQAALDKLEREGNGVGQSTLYEHIAWRDEKEPGWRGRILDSGQSGNPDWDELTWKAKKPRGKSRKPKR